MSSCQVLPLNAPASPDGRIDVSMGAGELWMDGIAGLDHVEVEATLCARSDDQLERLGVTLVPDGNVLRLTAIEPAQGRGARVDLTVRIPLGMKATVDETSVSPRPDGRLRRNRP